MTDYPRHALMQRETSEGLKEKFFIDVAYDQDDVKSIELETNFLHWIDNTLNDEERKQFEVLKKMFFHTIPERMPDTYFISGEAGEKNECGLPEYVSICPAYGVDFSVMYKRVDGQRS